MKRFPEYVRIGETAFRHNGARYYRWSGEWGIDAKFVGSSIVAVGVSDATAHMTGMKVVPISRRAWLRDEGLTAAEAPSGRHIGPGL